jgi:multiple sugar transport system permease protein
MAVATTPQQKTGWGIANFVVVALALIPVLWMVSLSFKTPAAILDPSFVPKAWTFSNYTGILETSQFIRPLLNSIGIGLIATLIAVVLASMAAYAVARLNFPGKGVLIGMALLIAMFPQIALVTPLFNIERGLGLFNTWPGLIIPYVAFGLPLGIYTLSAFFREIPWELEKAAKVDRAGLHRLLQRQLAVHRADRAHRGRGGGHHHPDHHLRGVLPAPHRGRADVRRGQGLASAES